MTMFRCFSIPSERKVKNKGNEKSSKEKFNAALAKLQSSRVSPEAKDLVPITFDVRVPHHGVQRSSTLNVRGMSFESRVKAEVEETYDGDDENDDSPLIKTELSDFDLLRHGAAAGEDGNTSTDEKMNEGTDELEDRIDGYSQKSPDINETGHVSDPGISRSDFLASPMIKRSCSNLENRYVLRKIAKYLQPSNSQSFEDFQELSANPMVNFERSRPVRSHCSADRVMLKRHSSSQVLPSGSKKLWWKLLLWSHRNVHRPFSSKSKLIPASASLSCQCGYSSDTVEPKQSKALTHVESSESIDLQSLDIIIDGDDQTRGRFQNDDSGFCPQNQWFALSTESSSFSWVDAWVKDLEIQEPLPEDDFDDDNTKSIAFPPSPDARKTMKKSTSQLTLSEANRSKEILNANNAVQSLNPASSVAHISGVGIKAIPVMSHLSNLRSVNLSNNFIASITPGCLPKSIQTLDLSRNKISTVEGLRELTRLRVLDLSYNRISRIGQGLSSCTLIKELYLVGNKISDVEGLHRLFKLTVLDLSFNKITTAKVLGQLVANYNSIQALNLLGNPIQGNISAEQLNKAVCGLLPKLTYLNKQPLKAQRPREILTDSVAKAALGNSKRVSGRRAVKRVGQGGSSSRGNRTSAGVSQKSRNRIRR